MDITIMLAIAGGAVFLAIAVGTYILISGLRGPTPLEKAAETIDASTNLRSILNALAVKARSGLGVAGDDAETLVKGQRLLQQLWEGVTDERREALNGTKASTARTALNHWRVRQFGRLTGLARVVQLP